MKKFSKLVSTVLAVALLATLVPTFAFAADAENAVSDTEGNIITLFDFGNPDKIADYNFTGKDIAMSGFAAEGKTSSLKYTANIVFDGEKYVQNNEVVDFYYDENDLSPYMDTDATLNIRFYSEAEGSKFNFVYLGSENTDKVDITPNDGEPNPVSTYLQKQPAVGYGWQVYSVKLSDAMKKFANYSEDNMLNIRIVANAWNNLNATTGAAGYKDGDQLFIDEIYVDTNPVSYYDNLEADGNKVIWKSEDGIVSGSKPTINYDSDKEKGAYSTFKTQSTTIIFDMNKTTNDEGRDCYTSLFNTSDYKWFNVWIYSPKAQDAGFNIILYTNKRITADLDGDDKKGADDADDAALIDGVKHTSNNNLYPNMFWQIPQVNWKGWKLCSFKLPAASHKIISAEINVNGWDNDGKKNTAIDDEFTFGVDGMWVSNKETSPQAEWEASRVYSNDVALTPAPGEVVIADFTTPASVKSGTNVAATRDNPFIYNTVARFSFEPVQYAHLYDVSVYGKDSYVPSKTKGLYTLLNADKNADKSTFVTGITDDSYLNIWMYSPEVKYTWDGKHNGEYTIVLAYHNGTSQSLVPFNIIANWKGWKLISIPIGRAKAEFKTYGISYMYFAINGGWYAVTKNTKVAINESPKVNHTERTAAQLAQGWVQSGSVNVIAKTHKSMEDKKDSSGKLEYYTYEDANKNVITTSLTKKIFTADENHNFNYVDVARVWISNGAPDGEFSLNPADNSELICPEEANAPIALYSTEENIGKVTYKGIVRNADGTINTFDPVVENGSFAADEIDYGAQYGIYAEMYNTDGVKLTKDFTLKTETYHVSEITTSEDGKTSTVKMHGNLPKDYANAVLVAAVYSTNGDVVKLETVNKADYDSATGELTATINSVADNQTVKFMFLTGLDTLKPLADNVRK